MDSQSTIGAGKSGAQSRQRFGPDAPWFFPTMLLVLLLVSPVGCVVAVVAAVIGQKRRVRASRMAISAFAATGFAALLGLFGDDAGPFSVRWHLTSVAAVAENVKVLDGVNWTLGALDSGLSFLAGDLFEVNLPTFEGPGWSLLQAAAAGAPFGAMLGLWLAAAYSGWMAFRRRPLMKFEWGEDEHKWRRPEGVFDHLRARRSNQRLMSGQAASFPKTSYGLTGKVGIGVGEYGVLLRESTEAFQRPTLVFGGPRMGKTRFTMSLLAQLATRGSGVLVLDFKGDGEVPTFWAKFADSHDRRFLHFQTADKNGAPYKQPDPSAPAQQAFYDPVLRGNATSRADMLVNSVDRDGDAKAYFRAAYELTQTAFAVAEGTGYDMQRGSLPALKDLLDVEHLQRVADTKGPDGRPLLADNPDIVARVAQMVTSWKRDDVLRGAAQDVQRLISTRMLGPAVGAWMRPGPTVEQTVDLVRACLEGDVVVFSLPVQEYGDLARDVGTLALLDLQNAIAVLRRHLDRHREEVGNPDAPPPWAPMYVQIEEFGSAGSEAVLGVLNKAGDVQVRPFLSTQSYNDVVAVDGTGVFARRVLDQAGNIFAFQMTEKTGAEALSDTTEERKKIMPRGQTEFSGGWSGMGLKAANLGKIDENPHYERQVASSAFQKLPKYTMIWLKTAPTQATHSFKAHANRWEERISTAPVPPAATVSLSRPAPGATREGPSLDDIDDSAVSPDEVGFGGPGPATGPETAVLPVQAPQPGRGRRPAKGAAEVAPTAPQAPAAETTSTELPPDWDDDDDEGLHDLAPTQAWAAPTSEAPTTPVPVRPSPSGRPAPPPPREKPAWEKKWRSADEPAGPPQSTEKSVNRQAPTPDAASTPTTEDPTTQDSTTPATEAPKKGSAQDRQAQSESNGRAVTQTRPIVGSDRDTSGLLDLDGFDE